MEGKVEVHAYISGASKEMRLAWGLLTGHSKKNFKLIPSMVVVPVASCSNLTFDPLHVQYTYDLECTRWRII